MKKSEDIMAAKEVADYLNLQAFAIHKYARQDKIPAFKIDADWRFYRSYIERWIKQKIYFYTNQKKKKVFEL